MEPIKTNEIIVSGILSQEMENLLDIERLKLTDIGERLKKRLIEIPINYTAFRELYRLAKDLNVEAKAIYPLLNELCEKNILIKKIEYTCRTCRTTTVLNNEELKEIIEEDNCFECEECGNIINPNRDTTGYIFYDIEDRQALAQW